MIKKLKRIFLVMVFFATSMTFNSPVSAAGESISVSRTIFSPGTPSNVGITLAGFDQTQSYQATVKFVNTTTNADVTNGTMVATQGATSLISGYGSYSAAKLGFKGTYAAITSALSSITWNPATASGNISIRIGIASIPGANEFYDANSGHYYKFVSSGLPWVDARTASEATILYGLRGYLAEINSDAENTFIGNETTATNVWMGASDRAVEGTWIWDGATSTYNKPDGSGGSALGVGGAYASWATGEPNDHVSGGVDREDCGVTNWQGVVGKWNDLPCGSSYSYLMEFGGRPGEVSTANTATLTTTVSAVVPTTISVPAISGVTVPTTGATPVSTVTAGNGYTGTVSWSPLGSPFAQLTSYTATVTLDPAPGYTLTGVGANFFTVAGATSVTHNANSGVVTVVFPATAITPPTFTISSSSENATQLSAISGYSISSTGGAIASYSISPAISNTPGLSFNGSTGLVSGIPTLPGVAKSYTITATNASGSASRTYVLTVTALPPSVFREITPPKISRDKNNYICSSGTFIFSRYGSIEEIPKLATQKYSLFKDGVVVESTETKQLQALFEIKDAYLDSTLSCTVQLAQENIVATFSSLNLGLISRAQEIQRVENKQINVTYYEDIDAAYAKKDKEFARISQVKAEEIAGAKTAASVSAASVKYQDSFAAASVLWKFDLKKAATDRDNAREDAFTTYLDTLEKAGVSIYPRRAVSTVTPTPTATPTPTVTPTPTATPTPTVTPTNPQPTQKMLIVGTVYMATGTYFLNDETKRTLTTIAQKINTSEAKSILVYGHADNRGGVNNTVLSQNRAKAVAAFLRPLVGSKKISIGWFSSNKPANTGTSAGALAQNRRVEIYTK